MYIFFTCHTDCSLSFILIPLILVAAKCTKETASAGSNLQKTEIEAENLMSPNTANEESKPATTTALPEEKCKPQLAQIEGDVTVDCQKTEEKEKEGEERAEGDSQPDPAVISQEEGTYH